MRTPHTSTNKGRRVIIKLRNGEYVIDKFVERTRKYIVLENHKFTVADILSFSIYREKITLDRNSIAGLK